MAKVVLPFSDVSSAFGMFEGTVSIRFVISPIALVYIAVGMVHHAVAIRLVSGPGADVLAAVLPNLRALSIFHSVQQLTLVLRAVVQRNGPVELPSSILHVLCLGRVANDLIYLSHQAFLGLRIFVFICFSFLSVFSIGVVVTQEDPGALLSDDALAVLHLRILLLVDDVLHLGHLHMLRDVLHVLVLFVDLLQRLLGEPAELADHPLDLLLVPVIVDN